MKIFRFLLAGFLTITLLSACGSSVSDGDNGDNNTASITGTAATGAAIANKTVTAVDANGVQTTTVTTADGSFTISVDKTAKPYMLKVEANGETLFAVALEPGDRANITPMTTVAVQEMNRDTSGYGSLDELFNTFNQQNAVINQQALDTAIAKVNANLATLFADNGVPNSFNFLTEAFNANGMGIDGVLDGVKISFDATNPGFISFMIGDISFMFDPEIDISQFMGGGMTGGTGTLSGNWRMTISGSASGISVADIVIDNIPAEAVPTESGSDSAQQEFTRQFGSIGEISNYTYELVSFSATKVVVRITATITVNVQGSPIPAGYDMIFTYDKM